MIRATLTVLLLTTALAGSVAAQDPVNDGVAKARALVGEGKLEAGLDVLRALAEKHPDDRLPHWWLANFLYQEAGRNREAAEVIAAFLEQHPEDEYALALLKAIANHALETGDAKVTRWCIEYFLRFDPNEKSNFYLAALASYRLGDRDAARGACNEIIGRWPSYADAHLLLARLYEDEGKFDLAVEAYRALIEEKPGFAHARLILASRLLVEFRDYDAAEAEFRNALDVAEPGSEDEREARRGLEQTRSERALAGRLRDQRGMLRTLIWVLLAVGAAATAAAVYLTRARRA
jgi:tetratricopeptide (TPR) repeat protein